MELQNTISFDQTGLEKMFQPLESEYQGSKSHIIMGRVGKISSHILSFGKAIDVVVGQSNLPVGLIWGGMRVLLEVRETSSTRRGLLLTRSSIYRFQVHLLICMSNYLT